MASHITQGINHKTPDKMAKPQPKRQTPEKNDKTHNDNDNTQRWLQKKNNDKIKPTGATPHPTRMTKNPKKTIQQKRQKI